MTPENERWNIGQPHEAGFWSIVSESGKVIALRVTQEKYARLICGDHNATLNVAEQCAQQCEIEAADVASLDDVRISGGSEIARQCAARIRRHFGLTP